MTSPVTINIPKSAFLPAYHHLLESKADVNLLWGGRDSGKSHHIAQQLIIDCLRSDYFRCILIKKTHESIKDAQWQTIKDIILYWGLGHLFVFRSHPLEIECVNGNKFIARGCDKPEKMKSIKDPSSCWIEEADQLTLNDYTTIVTTLRSNIARVVQWISFNPETRGKYEDFWIYKTYFKDESELYCKSFTSSISVDVDGVDYEIVFTSTHTTYKDNPFCTPERIAIHESLINSNPHKYQVFTLGHWGNEDNENPFFYSYDQSKHYTPTKYQIDPVHSLDVSFDFNKDPCTAVVGQHIPHRHEYHIVSAHYASPDHKSSLENLCREIERMYIGIGEGKTNKHRLRITGDAAGRQGDADRAADVNRYTKICQYFGISTSQVKVERTNLKHTASRDLCNDVLHQIPKGHFVFHAGTEKLIEEIEASYPDAKGGLDKAKKELGLHALDAWRYLLKFWFAHGLNGGSFREYQKKLDFLSRTLSKWQN